MRSGIPFAIIEVMKDYEALQKICLREVAEAGIEPGHIETFTVNHRAKTRWGLCRKTGKNSYSIEIAEALLSDDRISETACKETIIHEILHTCRGCMRHTGRWKEYAERMNARYGYRIKRVTTGSEKGVEDHVSRSQPVRYIYRCKRCGQLVMRKRACHFTRYYRNYSCGICGKWRAFERIQ